MIPRTRAGLIKVRPIRPGSRVALVAPASHFKRDEFDAGLAELRRLGFEPVYDENIFDKLTFRAGSAAWRASALRRAWTIHDVDAVIAVRGGYGSVETLPELDAAEIRASRTAFVGYSDVTSIHTFINHDAGLVSIHGPMIEGRIAAGESAYDVRTFLRALSDEPLGILKADTVQVVRHGEADGPMFGGTLTQLLSSLSTPFEFRPPKGHILFLDEVGERPYRLHRMLTHLQQSGLLALASGVVFNQMPRCDEPDGGITALDVIREVFEHFPGPVLYGFPSGHVTTTLITLPFGVHARVVAGAEPAIIFEEAAAA